MTTTDAMIAHPVFELALKALGKNGQTTVLSPAGRERLELALENLAGTPDLKPAVHSLAMLAYLLEKQGSGVAARTLLGLTEEMLGRKAKKGVYDM